MHILELALKLASEDYPLGTIVLCYPSDRKGVWKKMDGCENLHPGSGLDYRKYNARGTPGPAIYFERVA